MMLRNALFLVFGLALLTQIASALPTMSTTTILPASPATNDTIAGYCNATDTNTSARIGYNWAWYLNGTLNTTGSSTKCYQETANVSTACGGLGTGGYSVNYTELNGGGDPQASVYVNYSKPTYATSALWQVKLGSGPDCCGGNLTPTILYYNITLPTTCFNQSQVQLRMTMGMTYDYGSCYNGTDWQGITNGTGGNIINGAYDPNWDYRADILYDGDWNSGGYGWMMFNALPTPGFAGFDIKSYPGSWASLWYEEAVIWDIRYPQSTIQNLNNISGTTPPSNFVKGQNWTFSCQAVTTPGNSTWQNSSVATMRAVSPPRITSNGTTTKYPPAFKVNITGITAADYDPEDFLNTTISASAGTCAIIGESNSTYGRVTNISCTGVATGSFTLNVTYFDKENLSASTIYNLDYGNVVPQAINVTVNGNTTSGYTCNYTYYDPDNSITQILCEQQYANVSACGSNGTGAYYFAEESYNVNNTPISGGVWDATKYNSLDNNLTSFAVPTWIPGTIINGYTYINFTKPSFANLATSYLKTTHSGLSTASSFAPASCTGAYTDKIMLRLMSQKWGSGSNFSGGRIYPQCYNGSTWNIYHTITDVLLYEINGMEWDVTPNHGEQIKWFLNGNLTNETSAYFNITNVPSNSQLTCQVMVADYYDNSTAVNATPISIADFRAPEISNITVPSTTMNNVATNIYAACVDDVGVAIGYPTVRWTNPNNIVEGPFTMTAYSGNTYRRIYTFAIVGTYTNITFTCVDGLNNNVTTNYNGNIISSAPVVPPQQGGGGGGGSAITTKPSCGIVIIPTTITIDDNHQLVEVSLSNAQNGSYTPDIGFRDIPGKPSVTGHVSVANELGTTLAGQTKRFGVQFKGGLFAIEEKYGNAEMVLTSTNCADIVIPIIMNITARNSITGQFIEGEGTLGSRFQKLFEEPVTQSAPWAKIGYLGILMTLLVGALLYNQMWSRDQVVNVIVKVIAGIIIIAIATGVIVVAARAVIG